MTDKFLQEQLDAFKLAFDLFDKKGHGTISYKDLPACASHVGVKITNIESDIVMSMCNLNQDGKLDFNEFLIILAMEKANEDDMNKLTFRFLDKDNDGFINANDLFRIITILGIHISVKEIEDKIKELNPKVPGKINFEEYSKFHK